MIEKPVYFLFADVTAPINRKKVKKLPLLRAEVVFKQLARQLAKVAAAFCRWGRACGSLYIDPDPTHLFMDPELGP